MKVLCEYACDSRRYETRSQYVSIFNFKSQQEVSALFKISIRNLTYYPETKRRHETDIFKF